MLISGLVIIYTYFTILHKLKKTDIKKVNIYIKTASYSTGSLIFNKGIIEKETRSQILWIFRLLKI